MKRKSIGKKMLVSTTVILCVVLLMGMNACATVQYTVQKMPIDEMEAKLQSILGSRSFIKIKTQSETLFVEKFNESSKQDMYNNILQTLHEKLPTGYEPICPMLAEILLQLMMTIVLLFGHGIIGIGVAMTVFWIVGLCGSMLAGMQLVPTILVLFAGGAIAFIQSFLGDESIIYDFGILGAGILFICLSPIILCLLVIAVPTAYIFAVLVILDDCYNYIYEIQP